MLIFSHMIVLKNNPLSQRRVVRLLRKLLFFSLTFVVLFLCVLLGQTQAGEVLQYGSGGTSTCNTLTWPTDLQWIAIPSLDDPNDSLAKGYLDFVGDFSSYHTCYHYTTSNYMFFRIRVNYSGSVTADSPFADTILIMIDYNNDGTAEYAIAWDTKGGQTQAGEHGLEMLLYDTTQPTWYYTSFKDLDGLVGQKKSPPDFNKTGDGCVRTIDGVSSGSLGTTTFIDFAISCSYLSSDKTPYSNIALRCTGQTWKIQLGSISNETDHGWVRYDVAANSSPTTDPKGWSSLTNAKIELLSFSGQRLSKGVNLSWSTGSEMSCGSFKVVRERKDDKTGRVLEQVEIPNDYIPCKNDPNGTTYQIADLSAEKDISYSYLLYELDVFGQKKMHGPLILKTGETRSSFSK